MEITGAIKAIMPVQTGVSQRTGNSWASMEFVIETQEQYPKHCVLKLFGQDKINSFRLQMGEVITACFDINAREYNGRWFNDISCFSIKRNGVVVPVVQQQQAPQGYQQPQNGNLFPPTVNQQGQPVNNGQQIPQGYQQQYVPPTQGQEPPF